MLTKYPKILAVDPGTKELGIAVLSKMQLEYYGVKTFKHRQPPQAFLSDVSRCIDTLIADRHPVALAIEQTFLIQRESALLNVTASTIKYTANQYGLSVHEYEPTKVRQAICQNGKATKGQMVRIIADRYPELAQYLKGKTKWEGLYWAHMFDAVAVGLMCLREVYEDEKEDPRFDLLNHLL